MSEIELRVRVDRKMFYNDKSNWGVFALSPVEKTNKVELNSYGNFVVNGSVQELFEENEYDVVITPSTHPKYGDGYSFVRVKFDKPNSVQEQQAYIRVMLKDSQANAIIDKYPDDKILDLMKDDRFDWNGIKGIREKTYQKIKNYLLSNLDIQEALIELQDLNITFAAMKKLVDHFGSPELVVSKVKDNIYNLCKVKSFGFLKVDAYAINRGDDKENNNRIRCGIEYILEQEEQSGHSWVGRNGLIEQAKDLLQIDKSLIQECLVDLEVDIQKDIYINDDQVALYRNYRYESKIKKLLFRLNESRNTLYVKDVNEKISEVEKLNGFEYTEEQRSSIRLASENNVFILNGKSGTGKTTSLKGILGVLSQYNHVCVALSGKASKLMANHGLHAMTIHRMLGVDPNGGFLHNEKNKLPYQIIVLDEASMCSNYIMYSVISAVREGAKLIILGDSGQLAPIGAGAVFDDLLKSRKLPMQELTIVQRQAKKSGILSEANKIRAGHQIIDRYTYGKQVFGELKDFVVLPMQQKEEIKDIVLEICKNYKGKDIQEFQVITGLKSRGDISVKNLNVELQGVFNDLNKPFVKRGGYEYRIGDKIIHNGNNYEAGEDGDLSVFNGTLGKIVHIEFANSKDKKAKDKIYIDFEGIEEAIMYTSDQLDMIELAYAISCHRSQGSTIHHVLFVFDYSSYMLLSRQFVYTGITRASKGCVMVCENRSLQHAIKTDHSGLRRTFLYDFLVSEEDN